MRRERLPTPVFWPGEFYGPWGRKESDKTEQLSFTYITMRGFPGSSVGKESACIAGDLGLISGSGRYPGEGIGYPLQYSWASLVDQLVKNPPTCGRPVFDPWVWKIPWRREQLPTPVFWHGEVHGLCSPLGHKELDTTE